MNRKPAHIVVQDLYLSGMNADPNLRVGPGKLDSDACSAFHRRGGADEGREEAVASGLHFPTAEPVKFMADNAIVVAQQLLPPKLPDSRCGLSRTNDVAHQYGQDGTGRGRRHGKVTDIARDVQDDGAFIADHPCVVSWRKVHDVISDELGLRAIAHPDTEPACKNDVKMVGLAPLGTHDGLDVGRPSPTRLEERTTHVDRAYPYQRTHPMRKLSDRVRL
jgi:hypothetical protein